MAFGGTQVNLAAGARTGQSQFQIAEITGLTLAATVASPPDRANADTGVLTTNQGAIDAVPANTNQFQTGWGPGQDNWSQRDVDSVTPVVLDQSTNVTSKLITTKALVANANPAPTGSTITNSNLEITTHNLGAGAGDVMTLRYVLEHSQIR